jgi:zinc transport system substrate-binding protein
VLHSSLKWLTLASWYLCSTAAYSAPNVLVSVSPLQGLVADLMQGVGKPELLLEDGADLHHFAYKPSDINKLSSAQLLIWVGERFEPDLPTYISNGIVTGKSLELARMLQKEQLLYLPSQSKSKVIDPHLWLSPSIMAEAITLIAANLIELDPPNASIYRSNGEVIFAELKGLSARLAHQLKPYQAKSFAVYHNAYSYLVREAGMQQPLVLESSVHGQLSLNSIRKLMQSADQRPNCVVVSSHDPVHKIKRVMASLEMKVVELNNVGAENYTQAIQAMLDDLVQCFDN